MKLIWLKGGIFMSSPSAFFASRRAGNAGYQVMVKEKDGEFLLELVKK